jgi:soluble lytic murein transglycosylase-like protein
MLPVAKVVLSATVALSVAAPPTFLALGHIAGRDHRKSSSETRPIAEIAVPQTVASMAAPPRWDPQARDPALLEAAFATVEEVKPPAPPPDSPRLTSVDSALTLLRQAGTPSPGSVARADLEALVRKEAAARGLPPDIAVALVTVASNWDPAQKGPDGEIGLMQVIPRIARQYGFKGDASALLAPAENIHWGVAYAEGAWRKGGRDLCRMAMKIKSGHAADTMTPEHRAYCARIKEAMAAVPESNPQAEAAQPTATPEGG